MKEIRVQIRPGDEAAFRNRTRYCVGTGRMGLALHREYQEQLRAVQEKCAFEHIRGHGLFSDDMGIYQKRRDPDGETRVQYCFTYLDRVMDSYREAGLKPFLELGFMPEKMASGTQTIFYWKGHVTPPADMKDWTDLVQATLTHLCKRYGKDEVATWPLEVWNEPNLRGFWENAQIPGAVRGHLQGGQGSAARGAGRRAGHLRRGRKPGVDPGFPCLLFGKEAGLRFCHQARLYGGNAGAPGQVPLSPDARGGRPDRGNARKPGHHRFLPGLPGHPDVYHGVQYQL